jgi:hypothetical protein
MRMRREWVLLSVLIATIVVVVAILLHGPSNQPYTPIIQNSDTAPIAPSGLAGQAVSSSRIAIHWVDNSRNEDGFRIYRNGALLASVAPDITTFQDNDLSYATVYSYLVTAYNEYGETRSPNTASIRTSNPPITVTLSRIGVLFDHDPFVKGRGEIYVYIGVADGKSEPQLVRVPSSGTISLNDNESQEIHQELFASDSVGDELRIVALAFESDDAVVEQLLNLLKSAFMAYLSSKTGNMGAAVTEGIGLLTDLLQSQPSAEDDTYQEMAESTADDFVGAIEQTWTVAEDWGIGSHANATSGDLRLWFTISTS